MDATIQTHLDSALRKIEQLYIKTINRLEQIKVGQKITQAFLLEQLALETGQTEAQIYPFLHTLLAGYPMIKQSRGRYGGLERVLPVEKTTETGLTSNETSPKIEGATNGSGGNCSTADETIINNKEQETNG